MNDLPVFLQMFVRLFAVLALGAWLQTVASKKSEESGEASRCPAVKQQVHAQTDAPPPADQASAPAERK